MALTPEDVIKKSFNATHLRRGYDETQVDDFLDEVVVEMRRLRAQDGAAGEVPASSDDGTDGLAELRRERDDLAAQVEQLQAGASSSGVDTDERSSELEQRLAEAEQRADQAEQQLREEQELAGAGDVQGGAGLAGAEPARIIALAQRVHDEYVSEGESTKQRLIAEAEEHRERVVGEADQRHEELMRTGQEQHEELVRTGQEENERLIAEGAARREEMVGEAERQRSSVLADLAQQESSLDSRIEHLAAFEQDYRSRLRTFMNEQLVKLDERVQVDDRPQPDGHSQPDGEPQQE